MEENSLPSSQIPEATSSTSTHQYEEERPHLRKNVYPILRHMLLVVFTLLAIAIILFLIHQNGKSIYDKGL